MYAEVGGHFNTSIYFSRENAFPKRKSGLGNINADETVILRRQ